MRRLPVAKWKVLGLIGPLLLGTHGVLAQEDPGPTIGVRSASAAPGERITVQLELSAGAWYVACLQGVVEVAATDSASPPVRVCSFDSGELKETIVTSPDLSAIGVVGSVAFVVPATLPAKGEVPSVDGPACLGRIALVVPPDARVGTTYRLVLGGVLVASDLASPIAVKPVEGVLTISAKEPR